MTIEGKWLKNGDCLHSLHIYSNHLKYLLERFPYFTARDISEIQIEQILSIGRHVTIYTVVTVNRQKDERPRQKLHCPRKLNCVSPKSVKPATGNLIIITCDFFRTHRTHILIVLQPKQIIAKMPTFMLCLISAVKTKQSNPKDDELHVAVCT